MTSDSKHPHDNDNYNYSDDYDDNLHQTTTNGHLNATEGAEGAAAGQQGSRRDTSRAPGVFFFLFFFVLY
jgi:hypothetical protein